MLKRVRSNPPLWDDILAAAGIDNYTFAGDLNRMRFAKKTEFYQGKAVAVVEDNNTQIRAVELEGEILGHRKTNVELTGALGIKSYRIVSPDNWDESTDADVIAPPTATPLPPLEVEQ
jgi:hypothetical protein